mgnify:CR=1 FL=1
MYTKPRVLILQSVLSELIMAGVVLENISTKKLVAISVFLLSLSVAFFLMGGILGMSMLLIKLMQQSIRLL